MSCRAISSALIAGSNMPSQSRRTSVPCGVHLNGAEAVRQRAFETRLEVEVQAFEGHKEWARREDDAYHIILRYLSPNVSIHVAGLETSRDLWNELEERYRRMELATFCEPFA